MSKICNTFFFHFMRSQVTINLQIRPNTSCINMHALKHKTKNLNQTATIVLFPIFSCVFSFGHNLDQNMVKH